jgi:hypothetical protein
LPANPTTSRQILESSIEEGLSQVVGESGLRMFSILLEPVDLASADPRKFHELLVSLFREGSAPIIERQIARKLLGKLGRARPDADAPKPEGDMEYDSKVVPQSAEVAQLSGDRSMRPPLRAISDSERARDSMESLAAHFMTPYLLTLK